MNVYVGIDVHRKRSQIAVLDAAGDEQRNGNVPNDPVKLVPILVCWRRARRSRSRPPTAGVAGGVVGGTGAAGTAPGPPQPR
jgi:hypothetical protein